MPQRIPALHPSSDLRELSIALARGLRHAGAPAHRVEDRMSEFARATGLDLAFHVFPSALLASVGSETTVVEVAPGPPDLHRLSALEELAEQVAAGTVGPAEGLERARELALAPGRYSRAATLIAFATASAAAVPFFGGGAIEALAAAAIGGLSGALSLALAGRRHAANLVEIAAAAAGTFALAALARVLPVAGDIALITGLIVLLPGFALTTALTELATGHRVSGTAGLAAGVLILMELGFGTVVGSRLAEALLGPTRFAEPMFPVPAAFAPIALCAVALAFAVLLQARPRHLVQVLGACALAVYGSKLAGAFLGPELAGGAAAVAVTVVANAMSRWQRQPAAVWQLPGILLLVPGSIGFRSVTALLDHDVLAGVEGAFGTALACMALVGGSLLGSALVSPRRSL